LSVLHKMEKRISQLFYRSKIAFLKFSVNKLYSIDFCGGLEKGHLPMCFFVYAQKNVYIFRFSLCIASVGLQKCVDFKFCKLLLLLLCVNVENVFTTWIWTNFVNIEFSRLFSIMYALHDMRVLRKSKSFLCKCMYVCIGLLILS